MSEQHAIIIEVFDLADTIGEGLQHLEKRMGEGHFEDTGYLFEDIKEAFKTISRAIEPDVSEQMTLGELSEKFSTALDNMNANYDHSKLDLARMDLQFVLLPAYKGWQSELQKCFRHLIES
jgi:hypothetical protein